MLYPNYRKWDVIWVDFPDTASYVFRGKHPAVVVSNNRHCMTGQTLMVIPGTSTEFADEKDLFGQVVVPASAASGLTMNTRFDCGRIMTIDLAWILDCLGTLVNTQYLYRLESALTETLELLGPAGRTGVSRALSLVRCPGCGVQFVTRLGIGQQVIHCNVCDTEIQTEEMKPIDITCPDCGMKLAGLCNLEPDPDIEHLHTCKCGHQIPFHYDKAKGKFIAT